MEAQVSLSMACLIRVKFSHDKPSRDSKNRPVSPSPKSDDELKSPLLRLLLLLLPNDLDLFRTPFIGNVESG